MQQLTENCQSSL